MVNGVTHDHAYTPEYIVPIAVYVAERQALRRSLSGREAWDAGNSGSRWRDNKMWIWAGGLCGSCASLFASIIVYRIVYRLFGVSFSYINVDYRYRYRRFFGLIVSKCYLFRHPTLVVTVAISVPYLKHTWRKRTNIIQHPSTPYPSAPAPHPVCVCDRMYRLFLLERWTSHYAVTKSAVKSK